MAYRQRMEDLVRTLGADDSQGLTDDEARRRLERHGRNELTAEKPVPAWRRFVAQFQDVLVVLLLLATAISAALWAYERDAALPYEALAIFAVVVLNATMGYLQESRAEAAVAALREMSAADATVIRGSERRSIPAADARPGRHHPDRGGRHDPGRRTDPRVGLAADRRSSADRGEPPGHQGRRDHRGRRAARRPHQHGLQRHRSDVRAWQGRGDRHRHAHRDGADRRPPEGDRRRGDASPAGTRSHRQAARRRRHRHRDRDDRHDRRGRGRARRVGVVRRADPRCGAGGRCGPRGPSGSRHRGAVDRCAAHGATQRHRAAPGRGGDAGIGERDRVRQDRHAHQERDDGASGRDRERPVHVRRLRLRPDR